MIDLGHFFSTVFESISDGAEEPASNADPDDRGERKQGLRCLKCNKFIVVRKGQFFGLTSHLRYAHHDIYSGHVQILKSDYNVQMELNRLEMVQHCVKLVAFGNMPFATISKPFFREIFRQQLVEFQQCQRSLDLVSPELKEIKEYVCFVADKIVDHISKEVSCKPVALMLDIMSRHQRKVIGLSIQYLVKDIITVRTIGLLELPKAMRYTRPNVRNAVKGCLDKYGIKSYQIASSTSDNGSNVISLVQHFPFDFHEHEMGELPEDVTADNIPESSENTTGPLPIQPISERAADTDASAEMVMPDCYTARDIDDVRNSRS